MTLPGGALPGLDAAGEMSGRIRRHDWAATSIGPIGSWPPSLRTTVGTMLNTRYPMLLFWGPDLVCIYNDAFRPTLGADMHPGALGGAGRVVWSDVWEFTGPQVEAVMAEGVNTGFDDQLVPFDRNGYFEEMYFTYSYSPVFAEDGSVGGTLVVCNETTDQVISERRMTTLQGLATAADPHDDDPDGAVAGRDLLDALRTNDADIPFALLYDVDPGGAGATLVGTTGIVAGSPGAPARLDLRPDSAPTPWTDAVRSVAERRRPVEIRDLRKRAEPLPGGAWPESPREAMALPVGGGVDAHAFVLVAAVSARKALDPAYRRFLGLASDQFSAAVARAVRRHQDSERVDRLAELDRAKTTFLSTVSHELRTPLTLVLGPLQNLLEQPETAHSPEVQTAYRNARRLLRLVDTLLDFSRIEAGRMAFAPRPTDVAALTRDCAALFTSSASGRGLELRVDCDEPVLAEVDPDMWEKIVVNLVSNAIKYTRGGHVDVRIERRDGSAALVVSDSGIGIPADDLPLVFDRFHRTLSDLTPAVEGTGLGLALVRELATIHAGSATVRSTPGVGSTFVVTVPALDPAEGATPSVAPRDRPAIDVDALFDDVADPGPEPAAAPGDGAARILVVDDNHDMREFLARSLAPLAEVDVAADGRDALVRARRRPPDVIVSDVMMPVVDGVGLLTALRGDPELVEVPVILLSARADHDSVITGLDAGATDFLAKPFSTAELRSRIRTNLAAVQLRKARAAAEAEALRRREQQALELNDRIVQGMIVARLALDLGRLETVESALDTAIRAATTIITDLLGDPAGREEGLLRSVPAILEPNP